MPVYKFRVIYEDHEDVFRDIEILPNQTFEQFSDCFQHAISFDGTAVASFFVSDDFYRKGEAVTSSITTKKGEVFQTEIADFVESPHQRFLLRLHSKEQEKRFHIELIKIEKSENSLKVYPICVKSIGKAPRQYKKVFNTNPQVDEESLKESDNFFNDMAQQEPDDDAIMAETLSVNENEISEGFGQENEDGESIEFSSEEETNNEDENENSSFFSDDENVKEDY
jgi:hypothetical protein